MAGRYDPITPPAWSRQVADTLEQSWFHEFPGYGHGPSSEPCAADMVVAFIEDPATDPALPCRADLGPPVWVLPS
jgi:pimeloyl-ACP methyl ester carboxylesterase